MKKIKCYCGHTDYCDCGKIEPQVKTSNMKLYTEEQLRQAMDGFYDCDCTMDDIINRLNPIELPSDEEIEKLQDNNDNYDDYDFYDTGFKQGVKWMKEQILNQNK